MSDSREGIATFVKDEELRKYIDKIELKVKYVKNHKDAALTIADDFVTSENSLLIIVWEKHRVEKIEKNLFDGNNTTSKNLRQIFLKRDVLRNPEPFLECLREAQKEIRSKEVYGQKTEKIKNKGNFIEIGSLVDIGQYGAKLDDHFGQPRFTSLFIDKPMLHLMRVLVRILSGKQEAIRRMKEAYKALILEVKKTSGLDRRGGDSFSTTLIEGLSNLQKSSPIMIKPILLTGGTGVGKTLIARWLHSKGALEGSFQELNASGLPASLLESELFGYEKGAFTDAKKDKPGKALLALGGVLFLDEIGDMPYEVQPKVLKYLEEKTFSPEGWTRIKPIYAPLLIVAATNKDLNKEIKKGNFRRDLLARFAHVVHVPSIKERNDSIDVIVDFILQNDAINPPIKNLSKRKIQFISLEAIQKIKALSLEDNFRGLEKVIRNAATIAGEYGLDMILSDFIEE